MYKGFVKAKTPKYQDFRGIDFNQMLLSKENLMSQSNFRNSTQSNFLRALTQITKQQMNKSQKSEPNMLLQKPSMKESKQKSNKKKPQINNYFENNIRSEINLFNVEPDMTSTMKKTLEENNRERDILEENSKHILNSKLSSPNKSVSNVKQGSILNDSRKLAAFRASELKKRNRILIQKY